MKKTSYFVLVFSLLGCLTSAYAEEDKSIEQMLGAFKLEKIQASLILNQMGKSGRLSPDQIQRAKREIASVQEESLDDAKKEAMEKIQASKSSLATK